MISDLYFVEGSIIAQSGVVRIYEYKDDVFLEGGPGHFLWARESEAKEYHKQIGDLPKGDCLEIGLGLGESSKYILSKPNVNSLMTVEINLDVIKCFYQRFPGGLDEKHKIVLGNGTDFLIFTEYTFDFMFFDYYSLIDEDTLESLGSMIKAAKQRLNPGGVMVGWFDTSTPNEFVEDFYSLFRT